jgi:hypothetical protein
LPSCRWSTFRRRTWSRRRGGYSRPVGLPIPSPAPAWRSPDRSRPRYPWRDHHRDCPPTGRRPGWSRHKPQPPKRRERALKCQRIQGGAWDKSFLRVSLAATRPRAVVSHMARRRSRASMSWSAPSASIKKSLEAACNVHRRKKAHHRRALRRRCTRWLAFPRSIPAPEASLGTTHTRAVATFTTGAPSPVYRNRSTTLPAFPGASWRVHDHAEVDRGAAMTFPVLVQ